MLMHQQPCLPNTNTPPLFPRKGVMKQHFLPINQVMELKWLTWAWLHHVLETPVHGHEDGLINGDINLGYSSRILSEFQYLLAHYSTKNQFNTFWLFFNLYPPWVNSIIINNKFLLLKIHLLHKTWFYYHAVAFDSFSLWTFWLDPLLTLWLLELT